MDVYSVIWLSLSLSPLSKLLKNISSVIIPRITAMATLTYYDSLIISKDDLTLSEDKNIKYWDCDNYIYIHIKENIDNE